MRAADIGVRAHDDKQKLTFAYLLGRQPLAAECALDRLVSAAISTRYLAPSAIGTRFDSYTSAPPSAGGEGLPRLLELRAGAAEQQGEPHEARDGHHQAVQARGSPLGADRSRAAGHDRDGGQGLRPAEGSHGDLPRRRIRGELPAEDQDRGRRPVGHGGQGRGGHRPHRQDRADRRRQDLRLARSTMRCASARARPTTAPSDRPPPNLPPFTWRHYP